MPDLLVKLYELPDLQPLSTRLGQSGVLIRSAMPYEKKKIEKWVEREFGSAWASECDVAFSNKPVSCHIATKSGEILGFACFESTCRNFFGPVGVRKENRKSGIGKALLLSCLYAMKAIGYSYAIIGNVEISSFYMKTVGAVLIEGSTPGIYRDPLT